MNHKNVNKILKITHKKYGGNTSVVSLRMPDILIKKIDEIATLTERTRNDIIIKFIDFGLENFEIEKADNSNVDEKD